jgi:flagellar protein FlgJ
MNNDISAIGSFYLNNSNTPLDAMNALSKASSANASDGSFAAMLDKADSADKPIDKNSTLYKQCLELQTFLVKNVLQGMRDTVQKGDLFGEQDDFAQSSYEDMLWDQYAELYSKNCNWGLADAAYRQLA